MPILDAHGDAVAYDLLTLVGCHLSDVPARLSWHELALFLRWLPSTSATYRSMHPQEAAWADPLQAQATLADLYDLTAALYHGFVTAHAKAKPPRPKPYPRPSSMQGEERERHVGADAIPVADFERWYYSDH